MNSKTNSTIPKTHFFTEDDSKLFEYPQIFSAGSIWLEQGMQDNIATYDLVIRDMPKNRNFMLMGGTEEIIMAINNWRYSEEEANYLLKLKVISPRFAEYLQNFRFSGDVYALPEGTVFFSGEPVMRITAPIIEGNLFTLFLIDSLCGNVAFLTKFIRQTIAAKDKIVTGPAGIRGHTFESSMKASRAAYICGLAQHLPSIYRKYHMIQPTALVIAYHAYIKSFPSEYLAMKSMSDAIEELSVMIDTYDIDKGIANAIRVCKERMAQGKPPLRILIDSGDLFALSAKTRKALDNAGLTQVKITCASNLDEYKIEKLVKKGIVADGFIVATEAITVADDPRIEAVYKMAEITNENGSIPLAKLSKGKVSLPGRKQVFRQYQNGKIFKDTIGLETENFGKPLLEKFIENGKLIREFPNLLEIKDYVSCQISTLPEKLKSINKTYKFTPEVSKKLVSELEEVKKIHVRSNTH